MKKPAGLSVHKSRHWAVPVLGGILIAFAFALPAQAFTWNLPLCQTFAGCNSKQMGNAGYETEYQSVDHWGMDRGHNCTNYTAYRLIKNNIDASYLRGQGMAWQWGGVAASHGVAVDKSPRVGDIAWFDKNSGIGGVGHVAYVEHVNTNGTVRVSEDNYGGDFDWRDYQISDVTGFIHFGGGGGGAGGADVLVSGWNRVNVNGDHKAIVGPAGSGWETSLGSLVTTSSSNRRALYSCSIGSDEFTSTDANCEGQHVNRRLGYAYTSPPSGLSTRPVYRCMVNGSGEHFDSLVSNCEGHRSEGLLGYTVAYVAWNRVNVNGDHKAIVGPAGSGWETSLGSLVTTSSSNRRALYSCSIGSDEFTSTDANCEGQHVNRRLGYAYTSPPSGLSTRPVYRCMVNGSGEHFDSLVSNCEGHRSEGLLGYTVAYVAWNRVNVNGDHKAIVGPAGSGWETSLGSLVTTSSSNRRALYSCSIGSDEFTSTDANCEGQHVNRRLGYAYTSPPSGLSTRPVYRCMVNGSGEHFDSLVSNCEGHRSEGLLGYTVAYN